MSRRGSRRTIVERLNKRTTEAKMIKAWRAGLVRDLGGDEGMNTATKELVEQACRLKLAVDRADIDPLLSATDLGASRTTTLRRALLYTFKLLGLSVDRRVRTVKPQSKAAEIRERYRRQAEESRAEAKAATPAAAKG